MDLAVLRNLDLNLLTVLDVLLEERHVTRAAKRLGRSQSAVSHALGRLRVQLDDPLLIRSGGVMQLSVKARRLQPRLRQILLDLEDALSHRTDWEPQSCRRHFSLAGPDFTAAALPLILQRLEREAPHATCELHPLEPQMFQNLTLGRYDLVFFRNIDSGSRLLNNPVGVLKHAVFARRGHPALSSWGLDAWLAYPHIRIRMMGGPSPVSVGLDEQGFERKLGPVVSSFLMTAPILAKTDTLLTAPHGVMRHLIGHYDIEVRPCPVEIDDIALSLFSSGLELDPAQQWFEGIVHEALVRVFAHPLGVASDAS